MNAKNLQDLVTNIGMCDNSLDYIVVFREFLKECGEDSYDFGINRIIYETIKKLSTNLNIKEIMIDNYFYNVGSPLYNVERFYNMKEYGFKLALQEPKFDIDNLIEETSFIQGIEYIEFEDGKKLKLSELGTDEIEGGLSEIDTFFSFFDLDTYKDVMDKINSKCWISKSKNDEMELSDEYILIINQLILNFLDGE